MKNIVFFSGSMNNSGGTERVASLIANELDKLGYNVSFLSLYNGNTPFFPLSDSIAIHSLYPNKVNFKKHFPQVCFKLRRFILKNNTDVLINIESMLAIYSIPALLKTNVKNICWEHFNFNVDLGNKLRRLARRLAARYCTQVITLTERDKQLWLDHLTVKTRIDAIPNPSPFEPIMPLKKINNKVVLAAGRLTSQKGFDLLIDSWQYVILKRQDWTLRIVGSGEDKAWLHDKAEALGLTDSIEWVENVTNMAEQYSQADMYVMSSRYEGLPMVLIEALSFGLPIVSFDCETGPSEIVNTECGWLTQDGDTLELGKSILLALEQLEDPNTYNAYSTAAIEQCRAKFSLTPIVKEWLKVLEY
ncbi:glycosyltransferase family 4 protein [Vibrio nitrifigilis]|uniref:Glycosyltransferase family 4 protein n=1 Tax=Vibrio nitrifigilis TaxID=2789781 RepID=A0ABS0GFI3_9VIBR|nr:glycosyltransferase family 4 protein [Vibrio nitrifigilis]MBF9001179.1 glycosyltransferase family 4 protein [Vibrio nitrifigilis]